MQIKLHGDFVMVCGRAAKNGELQHVGANKSRLCKLGLAVDKRPDPENPTGQPITVWANIVAWHNLASLLALARKGDSVLVIGQIKRREYEGKVYTDLEAEWLWVAALHSGQPQGSEDFVTAASEAWNRVRAEDNEDDDFPY